MIAFFLDSRKLADVAIICTQDKDHMAPAVLMAGGLRLIITFYLKSHEKIIYPVFLPVIFDSCFL